MISQATFMGRARTVGALSADLTLTTGSSRVVTVDPQFGGLDINLPDATGLRLGGPRLVLINLSGSYDVTIKNALDGTVTTLGASKVVELWLAAQADAGGTWLRAIGNDNT